MAGAESEAPLVLCFSPTASADEFRQVQAVLAASPGTQPVRLMFCRPDGESLQMEAGINLRVAMTPGTARQTRAVVAGGRDGERGDRLALIGICAEQSGEPSGKRTAERVRASMSFPAGWRSWQMGNVCDEPPCRSVSSGSSACFSLSEIVQSGAKRLPRRSISSIRCSPRSRLDGAIG